MEQKYYDEHGNEVTVEGRVPKKPGGCLKWALIIVGAFVVLGIIGAMFGGDDTSTEPNETDTTETVSIEEGATEAEAEEPEELALETTATEIIDTYGNNELQGEEKFGGKRVLLTGVVDDIVTSGNEVYLRFYSTTEEYWLESLEAYFSQDHREGLSVINSGDTVTLEGTVDGLTMFGDVKVIDSEVIDNEVIEQ